MPVKLLLPASDMTEDYRSIANSQQNELTKKLSVKELLEKGAGKKKDFRKKQLEFLFY